MGDRSWPALLMGGLLLAACSRASPAGRAALLVDAGRAGEAETLLAEHLDGKPDDGDARRQLIRVLGLRGQLERAEEQAEQLAEQLGARDPTPWIELGHAYELAHRYEEALALYDRAAEVAPRDPRGPRTGGLRAARWGEIDWAAPRLEEALRRDRRDAALWHALGLVRVHQGRYVEAEAAYRSGLEVDPHALEHRVGLATLALRRNRPADALEQYDWLAARRPEQGDPQLGRAYALWLLGRLAEARAALARARSLGVDTTVAGRLERAMLQGPPVRDLPTSATGPAPRDP